MRTITLEDRRNRLARRHHLAIRTARLADVAADLVGLHSSDAASVYLSARARTEAFSRAEMEFALYEERSLLRMLGMRRTMFVVPHDLAAVMDAACTQQLAPGERRRLIGYLEAQQVAEDGDSWLEDVEGRTLAALVTLDTATARELTAVVPELAIKLTFGEGKKWEGHVGVSTRVLFLLATAGLIVRGRPLGSWVSTQYRWSALETWLPAGLATPTAASAQADLVCRWLQSYGPGSLTDIKWWTGWGVRVTRAALDACGAVEVDMDGHTGYALPDDLEPEQTTGPWVALLPSLDPTVMGWKERAWYLGGHQPNLFDRNGNAGPTIWNNGRVVGGWSFHPDGEIRWRLLEDVGQEAETSIAEEAASLENWLGVDRFTPRFRTPLEKELSA